MASWSVIRAECAGYVATKPRPIFGDCRRTSAGDVGVIEMGRDRVFDGTIKDGFAAYRLRESKRGDTDVVAVERRNRSHHYGEGYRETGKALPLTMKLTERDARAVRDLLADYLEDSDDE